MLSTFYLTIMTWYVLILTSSFERGVETLSDRWKTWIHIFRSVQQNTWYVVMVNMMFFSVDVFLARQDPRWDQMLWLFHQRATQAVRTQKQVAFIAEVFTFTVWQNLEQRIQSLSKQNSFYSCRPFNFTHLQFLWRTRLLNNSGHR